MLVALPPNQNGYRMLLVFRFGSVVSVRFPSVGSGWAGPPMLTSADIV